MSALTVFDETSTGQRLHEVTITLSLASETMTVRELISRRIKAEVDRHNARPVEVYRGLVQPTDAERVLNGYKLRAARTIDFAAQLETALAAFARNGFLLLVGDEQVDDLEHEIVLTPKTEVRFVRLVPLVGG